MAVPDLPPAKVFKPKFNLPILEDYRSCAPKGFWKLFPSNLTQPKKSLVDGSALRALAVEAGFHDTDLLNAICRDLDTGAVIGCVGPCRKPTRASNAPSAFEHGEKVTDAIADWLSKGFCYGPVPISKVPANAKFSGIMTRPKPSGAVRIILNLSAPDGCSVNDGINSSDFPAVMSSTTKWLQALNRAGRGAKMAKVDWSDAYKHVGVALEDTELQWFSWLGMCFKELCLVFGGGSSAGIYDRLAKVVLFVVCFRSKFPRHLVCQHLDDCCACAPADSDWLERWDAAFFAVANELGVKLAPRDDPDKSFGPSTSGVILGVYYDTVKWTWCIQGEKLIRLMHSIKEVMTADVVRQDVIWSLVGKIIHIKPLIPTGRFNVDYLIQANKVSCVRTHPVPVSPQLKRQLGFWLTMLQLCGDEVSIPDPDEAAPAWTVEVFSDAAGGSWRTKGLGLGAVSRGWWVHLPWSNAINAGGATADGRRLDRLMSAWELLGPLLAVVSAPDMCRGRPVRVWVDNAGSVYIWRKGYSASCPFSTTIVKALATVVAALGCKLFVEKITRCSSPLAVMADALSKSDFSRFWGTAYKNGGFDLPLQPLVVPRALLQWVADPRPDDELGLRLVAELADRCPVLWRPPSSF